MADSSKSPVTLPSIKEMFPEHMMHGLHDGRTEYSRSSSAVLVKREHTPEYSRQSATPRPGCLVADNTHIISSHRHEYSPMQGPSQSSHFSRRQTDTTQDPLDIHYTYLAQSHRSSVDTRPQAAHSFSFDLLRPNAVTSSLDTIATSQSVAHQPRPAYSAYPSGRDGISQEESAELHRSRPNFRISLPPGVSQDNTVLYSMDGRPSSRGMEYAPGYQESARYPASPFIVSPSTASHLQTAPQPQVLPGSSYEEKKHCCPHCNKRFNRPSSLSIHVNTHTGAKPFICPYPGCQRRFNVNSNMRRHYRNHVSNSRRRDAVARLIEPTPPNMPPTPPLSASPTDTPVSHFSGSLPSSASSDTSTPLPSRSPSPVPSYYPQSEEEGDWFPSGSHYAPSTVGSEFATYDRRVYRGPADAGPGPSRTIINRRQRSRSSPVPPSAHRQAHHPGGPSQAVRPMRPRSSSCNVPGCNCQPAPPVSTALRPAFMASSARMSRSVGPPN